MHATDGNDGVLAACCRAYLEDVAGRGRSPKSMASYDLALRSFLAFAEGRWKTKARSVTPRDLRQYRLSLAERGLRPGTVHAYLRTVRNLFRWLTDRRRLFIDPSGDLVVRRPPRPLLPVPSEDDVRRLLAAPDTTTPLGVRDRALLETLYGGGLRRNEAVMLDAAHVDVGGQTVRVMGKGDRERVVPVGREAARWLETYMSGARRRLLKGGDVDALWIGRAGRLSYDSVAMIMRRHSAAAGLSGVSAHSLRRACATHMLAGGASALSVQEQLGHAGLGHLNQYLRVAIPEIRAMHGKSSPGQ